VTHIGGLAGRHLGCVPSSTTSPTNERFVAAWHAPFSKFSKRLLASRSEILNAAPRTLRAADAGSQRLKLYDLAMVNEEIDLVAVILDLPFEHRWVRSFKHHLFKSELIDDARDHVSTPGLDVFRNSLALDHDDIGASVEDALGVRDKPPILGALGFKPRWRTINLTEDLRFGGSLVPL
jgi:hypothetical protein